MNSSCARPTRGGGRVPARGPHSPLAEIPSRFPVPWATLPLDRQGARSSGEGHRSRRGFISDPTQGTGDRPGFRGPQGRTGVQETRGGGQGADREVVGAPRHQPDKPPLPDVAHRVSYGHAGSTPNARMCLMLQSKSAGTLIMKRMRWLGMCESGVAAIRGERRSAPSTLAGPATPRPRPPRRRRGSSRG